jgi:hypothetical protein
VPLIFFGNYDEEKTKAFTISINPSNAEFKGWKNPDNHPCHREKVFHTPDFEPLKKEYRINVLDYCKKYFTYTRNKNEVWFERLKTFSNNIFNPLSYSNGTLVHLDLVQWATKKQWSGLEKEIKEELLKNNRKFVKYLLDESKSLKYIFINGNTAVTYFQKYIIGKESLNPEEIFVPLSYGKRKIKIYQGYYKKNIKIIGWSSFIGDNNSNIISLAKDVNTLALNIKNIIK